MLFRSVSKSNIVLDKAILKLLPDDFIAKKRAVAMSMEGDKLAVAMVNPTDKYTIRENMLLQFNEYVNLFITMC